MTTRTQCVRNVNDSQRKRSALHKLSFVWPRNVSQDGPADPDSGRKCIPRIRRTTSLSMSTPKASAICWAIRRQPHLVLRRFISTTASMSSFAGPFGPGRPLHSGEKSMRYFRFVSIWWKCNRVDGRKTMAFLRTRAGRMRRMNKPAIIRSETRRLGARFLPRLRINS
jgi:hypothetical protein